LTDSNNNNEVIASSNINETSLTQPDNNKPNNNTKADHAESVVIDGLNIAAIIELGNSPLYV
jgi:hypothetical protein